METGSPGRMNTLRPLQMSRSLRGMADATVKAMTPTPGKRAPSPGARAPRFSTPGPRVAKAPSLPQATAGGLAHDPASARGNGGFETQPVLAAVDGLKATERCKDATLHRHLHIIEAARRTVLERRRQNAGAELNDILKAVFPRAKDNPELLEYEAGRGAPVTLEPSEELVVKMLIEEREAGEQVEAIRRGDDPRLAAWSFEAFMANQVRWMVRELGRGREQRDTLDERYRQLLAEYADMEQRSHDALLTLSQAEVAKKETLRALLESKDVHHKETMRLRTEIDTLRTKLVKALEEVHAPARNRGSAGTATRHLARTVGGRSSDEDAPAAPAPVQSSRVLAAATAAAAEAASAEAVAAVEAEFFKEKERMLRTTNQLRQDLDAMATKAKVATDRLSIATTEADVVKAQVAATKRNAESEVANLKQLLAAVKEAHVEQIAEMDKNARIAAQQLEAYDVTVAELKGDLHSVAAQLIAVQDMLLAGPSMQQLLHTTYVKEEDADTAHAEIGKLKGTVAKFIERWSAADRIDPMAVLRDVRARRGRSWGFTSSSAAAAEGAAVLRQRPGPGDEMDDTREQPLRPAEVLSSDGDLPPLPSRKHGARGHGRPGSASDRPELLPHLGDVLVTSTRSDRSPGPAKLPAPGPDGASVRSPLMSPTGRPVASTEQQTTPDLVPNAAVGTGTDAVDTDTVAVGTPLVLTMPRAVGTATIVTRGVGSQTDQAEPTGVGAVGGLGAVGSDEAHAKATARRARRSVMLSHSESPGVELVEAAGPASGGGGGGGGGPRRRSGDVGGRSPVAESGDGRLRRRGSVRDGDSWGSRGVSPMRPSGRLMRTSSVSSAVSMMEDEAALSETARSGTLRSFRSARSAGTGAGTGTTGRGSPGRGLPRVPSGKRGQGSAKGRRSRSGKRSIVGSAGQSRPRSSSPDRLAATASSADLKAPGDGDGGEDPDPLVTIDRLESDKVRLEEALAEALEGRATAEAAAKGAQEAIEEGSGTQLRSNARLQKLQAQVTREREQRQVMERSLQTLNKTVRLLEAQQLEATERSAEEIDSLHQTVAELRDENQRLSVSDLRATLHAKQRLFFEGAERMDRCLTSLNSTTSCAFCLEHVRDPIMLFPCGHMACRECFRDANAQRGVECPGLGAASVGLGFAPGTAPPTAAATFLDRRLMRADSNYRGPRHSPRAGAQRCATADASTHSRLPPLSGSPGSAGPMAPITPPPPPQYYCEECGDATVTGYLLSKRLEELVAKVDFVRGAIRDTRSGVLEGSGEPEPLLLDSSVPKNSTADAVDLDLDARAHVDPDSDHDVPGDPNAPTAAERHSKAPEPVAGTLPPIVASGPAPDAPPPP